MRSFLAISLFILGQQAASACPPELLNQLGNDAAFQVFAAAAQQASKSPGVKTQPPEARMGLNEFGFAVLKTESFFPEATMREIFESLPKSSTIVVEAESIFKPGDVLTDEPQALRLTESQLGPIRLYLGWLLTWINSALVSSGERVQLISADVRISKAGGEQNSFPKWHQDGGYLAAAVSLLGHGTEFLPTSPFLIAEAESLELECRGRSDHRATPRGQTLVFSCVERFRKTQSIPPTLHRTPAGDNDRMFLIVRYRSSPRT